MRQRRGAAATIGLLMATLVGLSYLPRKAAEPSVVTEGQPQSRTSVAGVTTALSSTRSEPEAKAPCVEIARRLTRFSLGEGEAAAGTLMPGFCFQGRNPYPESTFGRTVRFAIAIVPDPVQTHLALLFDRSIEAIEQAAQDENYSYDSSWFPWDDTEGKYSSLSDQLKAKALQKEKQQEPGILVFRRGIVKNDPTTRYAAGLVLFLVSEQPTGGINDTQFEHAMQWMQTLQPTPSDPRLLILGPTFSGSLPSLGRELERALDNGSIAKYPMGVRISSGATNSDTSVDWFEHFLLEQHVRARLPIEQKLEFRTFFEGDSLMTNRFLCYLQHEGYDLNHVAILSEDETAFGENTPASGNPVSSAPEPRCQRETPEKTRQKPKYLYYPRDIATLRSAYEKQSIFSAGKQQANAPSTLRGDLSEQAGAEHDTVRTYAEQLTPLAQEAVLFGITNILSSKNIEFVILRGSNSLDQLFLSEFLRRSYPSGRVVIDGSDLLFRRGMQGASLRGVMLLSPYPLVSWTQDAIPSIYGVQASSYRVFPEDLTEGIYIAARMLLRQGPAPAGESQVPINDYGVPKWAGEIGHESDEAERPATWVSVVGHRQFWPLAVLNDNTEADPVLKNTVNCTDTVESCNQGAFGPYNPSLLKPEVPSGRQNCQPPGSNSDCTKSGAEGDQKPPAVLTLPVEMMGLLLGCVVLSLWHVYCCWQGSIIRAPRVRAYFAPIPDVQHTALVFLGGLILGLLGITLGYSLWLGIDSLVLRWELLGSAAVVAIFLSGFVGCLKNYRLPVVSGIDKRRLDERIIRVRHWRRVAVLSLLPVLIAAASLRYFLLYKHLTIADKYPIFWRGVFLRSGVSGLLPQVLLLGGLYCWFWFNLHGLSLFGDDRPVLPSVDDLPSIPDPRTNVPNASGRMIKVFRVFSQQGSAQNIERNALPLGRSYVRSLLIFLPTSLVVLGVPLGEVSLRTLGERRFGSLIFFAICLCVALIMADTWQMLNTWSQLRQLLIFLDRLRFRRTLTGLKGLSGGSVWSLSGNVLEERYRLISRQLECLSNLKNTLAEWHVKDGKEARTRQSALDRIDQGDQKRKEFVRWYVDLLDDGIHRRSKLYDIKPLTQFQAELAATVAYFLGELLLPAWQSESGSLIVDQGAHGSSEESESGSRSPAAPAHIRAAEEFVVLPYMGFIQNTLGRLRTIAFSIASMFVAVTVGVSCYPFDPLPVIGGVFLILFALVGITMIFVYAEMCRDSTLSHITNTKPGELGVEFWSKLFAFGIGPLIGLLTTLFPSMTDFVVSFLQPGAQAFK
jgi:hypothetical protein